MVLKEKFDTIKTQSTIKRATIKRRIKNITKKMGFDAPTEKEGSYIPSQQPTAPPPIAPLETNLQERVQLRWQDFKQKREKRRAIPQAKAKTVSKPAPKKVTFDYDFDDFDMEI